MEKETFEKGEQISPIFSGICIYLLMIIFSRAYLITTLEPFVTVYCSEINHEWEYSVDWALIQFVKILTSCLVTEKFCKQIDTNLCCSKRIAKFHRIFVVFSNKTTYFPSNKKFWLFSKVSRHDFLHRLKYIPYARHYNPFMIPLQY